MIVSSGKKCTILLIYPHKFTAITRLLLPFTGRGRPYYTNYHLYWTTSPRRARQHSSELARAPFPS
jgi:hypothetical protein